MQDFKRWSGSQSSASPPPFASHGPNAMLMERAQAEHAADKGDSNRSVVGEDALNEAAACESCRKRKLKCSREVPACSQCVRLSCNCHYDHKRQKPGIKTGAIEALNRRLETLEKILLDSNGNQKALPAPNDSPGCLYHASLLLARELQSGDGRRVRLLASSDDDSDGQIRRNCEEDTQLTYGASDHRMHARRRSSQKRKRDWSDSDLIEQSWDDSDDDILTSSLPSIMVLNAVLDTFFSIIHPWVPILHLSRFREQLDDPHKRLELEIILHALVYTTMKHLKEEDLNISRSEMARQVRLSRKVIMLTAMDNLKIENIQALIIVAFDDIGSGQVSKAWPIIGSLTRTVEYLQLTVEPDDMRDFSLLTPLLLLNKPSDWTDCENRRRVFWNVFLLDRFCSVSTGWNTSLTSDDVRRRLPCDGGLWQHEKEAVTTPYFGIWNKSAAKIGNSIAYIPAHYPSPDQSVDPTSPNANSGSGPVDASKLGAFAYCIEATESLSQVTTFFLQQKVDFRDREKAGSWLTRFKELDLRLVHWKMFLPQKWKDSNISRDAAFINMDPNLTLAHITHNTSMILLHQHIAYPPLEWSELIRLPSSCSAGTCQSAAVETASISEKYLKYTKVGIVNSQFALCAFVAARILLVHWRYYDTPLLPEFFGLVESLETMSERWQGQFVPPRDASNPFKLNMAGKYALHLQSLHQKCLNSPQFRMDANFGGLLPPLAVPMPSASSISPSQQFPPDFQMSDIISEQRNQRQAKARAQSIRSQPYNSHPHSYSPSDMQAVSTDLPPSQAPFPVFPPPQAQHFTYPNQSQTQYKSAYFPGSPPSPPTMNGRMSPSGDGSGMMPNHHSHAHGNEHNIDELTAMSNSLLGQQFLEMDRVITLDETDFALDLGMWRNS